MLAGIYKAENRLDECLVLNTDGRICEAVSSNVFLIKGDQLFTPALSEGCVDGVMRNYLIYLLKGQGRTVTEKEITFDEILNGDEVFLTDVIHGVRWVGACKHKRYFNRFSKWLIHQLAEDVQIKKV